jgi:hypothetical protein
MRSNETSKLLFRGTGTVHDEGERYESEWQVFCGEGQDVDCNVGVWVVLGECVCEGED